ncbi:MAG TPA: flagellar motor switch protein FliG [Bacillota bacterium]|nr:flagellar motor switch protein FliG [Bacillota bacterium]HOK69763.1 flagellar motor switch protein FliG [Bacillota bacterium]HPP86156.1 flagellar motor switch protein FliG [Bacillota bacterium]
MKQKRSESLRKAATIVLALGIENASEVFKYLREDEIEALTVEIATMPSLSTEVMEQTLDEFYGLCEAQSFITEGGIEYAKAVLEKSKGATVAAAIIEKVTKTLQVKAFDFIYKADPKQILILIQNEHPQTIALILSYCTVEQSSAILSELPRDIQLDVVERIATMDSTSPEIVKDIERIIERKMQMSETGEFTEIGGTKYIAEVLNSVDRGTEKYILDELSKKDPKLCEEIRNDMFVFEDIANLEPIYIQRFLQDVNVNDLLIALKGASKEVVDVFYQNMSMRMRETLEEEAKYLRGVRLSDVEEKQQKLVALVRSLEDAGEIYIARGRKDEIIV